jgi:hypothetical protein
MLVEMENAFSCSVLNCRWGFLGFPCQNFSHWVFIVRFSGLPRPSSRFRGFTGSSDGPQLPFYCFLHGGWITHSENGRARTLFSSILWFELLIVPTLCTAIMQKYSLKLNPS